MHVVLLPLIIIIIIKQLVTQHMSVKNKMPNRSCDAAVIYINVTKKA